MEQNLIAFLKAHPTVAPLAGQRVVMLVAAENVERPLVVLVRTNTQPTMAKTGPTGDVRATFELHCLANDPASMSALGTAVRKALNGFKGNLGGLPVSFVGVTNERDSYESEARVFVRIIEGFMWYSETA